jgi:lipoprotein-anchoring transpeptidase ErfK/SrfK
MKHLVRLKNWLLVALCLCAFEERASSQLFKPSIAKPQQLIYRQAPTVYYRKNYAALTSDNVNVVVSLSRQRIYVMAGGAVAIDSPISSGKPPRPTPTGSFKIIQKDPDHRSNIYGNFVDKSGRIVRAGVSAVIDSAPSGTHFEGAPMIYFCRLTDAGVGMHVGVLPGYPASHGCIRLPQDVAAAIFATVRLGTPVQVIN